MREGIEDGSGSICFWIIVLAETAWLLTHRNSGQELAEALNY